MKNRNKTGMLIVMMLCVGLIMAGCNSGDKKHQQAAAGSKAPSEVWVLRVDDQDMYLDEVNAYALTFMESLGVEADTDVNAYYSESYPTLDDAFKAQLLVQMRQVKILYQKALDRGLTLSAEEEEVVDGLVNTFMEEHDSAIQERFGFDRSVIEKIYTEMQLIHKLEDIIEEESGYETVDYGTFYNFVFLTIELDDNGNGVLDDDGNYVKVSQTEQAAQKQKAEEVLARLQEGEDPERLIEEYDLSSTSGILHATSDSMRETYGLKDGETSGVIENNFGYTIHQIVSIVDEEYSSKVNEYSESSVKSNAVENQENEWFNSYYFSDDDLNNEVWEKFSFQDFL